MGKRNGWLTCDSTVGELYHTPVGHDAAVRSVQPGDAARIIKKC